MAPRRDKLTDLIETRDKLNSRIDKLVVSLNRVKADIAAEIEAREEALAENRKAAGMAKVEAP